MFSRTMLLVTLSCFIGDTDDKNPFKNLDVTSAAGSNLSPQTSWTLRKDFSPVMHREPKSVTEIVWVSCLLGPVVHW